MRSILPRLIPYLWVLGIGVAWGATQPLAKIAVSTGHGHFGLIFWQLVISALILGTVNAIRGRWLPVRGRVWVFYLIIACVGTLIPNTASFQAIAVLPSGIMSILLSLVPMLAFPIALMLGLDQFRLTRLIGLSLGLCGVILIVGVPDALPEAAMLAFIPLALLPPLMYAFEGNFVAKWGTGGAGPLQLLLGASLVGAVIALPLTLYHGHWINPIAPWGAAEVALFLSSAIHAIVYTMYVMIVGRYGAVFSVQVGYIVTAAGVMWAMVILGENYSGPIYLALGLMFAGIYLVSPKQRGSDD